MFPIENKQLNALKFRRKAQMTETITAPEPERDEVEAPPVQNSRDTHLAEMIDKFVAEREAPPLPPAPAQPTQDVTEMRQQIETLQQQVMTLNTKRRFELLPEYDRRGAIMKMIIQEL